MYMKSIFNIILLTGCCTLSSFVFAIAPNDQTPEQQSICASETGAAKGLCNAYCEAMDCDLGSMSNASPLACAKVKENYVKAKGAGALLPCECPAACAQGVQSLINAALNSTYGISGNTSCIYDTSREAGSISLYGTGNPLNGSITPSPTVFSLNISGGGCGGSFGPITSDPPPVVPSFGIGLTVSEQANCANLFIGQIQALTNFSPICNITP